MSVFTYACRRTGKTAGLIHAVMKQYIEFKSGNSDREPVVITANINHRRFMEQMICDRYKFSRCPIIVTTIGNACNLFCGYEKKYDYFIDEHEACLATLFSRNGILQKAVCTPEYIIEKEYISKLK